MPFAKQLSVNEEWRVTEAVRKGVGENRVAELFGVTVEQVREAIAEFDKVRAASEAWDAVLAAEIKNAQKK